MCPHPQTIFMRTLIALGALLVVLSGCTSDETRAKPEPIVITYIGSSAPGFAFEDSILQQFTNQTGIKVRFIPGPELNGDQLMHEQKLLTTTPRHPTSTLSTWCGRECSATAYWISPKNSPMRPANSFPH